MEDKLAYGTDIMHGYVANAWYISDKLDQFTEEFVELEQTYLKTLQNSNIELKGSTILKKRFKNGVTSLRSKDVEFYTALFQLLIKYKSMNLLFSVNKMSIIFDSRLLKWICLLEEKRMIKNQVLRKLVKLLNSQNVNSLLYQRFKTLSFMEGVFFYVRDRKRDRNPAMQDYKFSASANLFAVFSFAFSVK